MGLFDFITKAPTDSEIKGDIGENLTRIAAKTLTNGLVLHDILINGNEGYTSQIDLIVIGSKGIYVFEVKSFGNARIYGDRKNSKWYYYKHGSKYEIYNPIKQNQKHIQYLKTFLKDFGDIPFYSVIALLCDDFQISGESDGRTVIFNKLIDTSRALVAVAKKSPEILDKAKKQAIFDYINSHQIIGKDARQEHKEKVKSYKNDLENMRKQKICPYCKTELVLRSGKNGQFYGCKNYPGCRYTQKLSDK